MITFPELRQTYNYDCGAKVTQAVLAYYGLDVSEIEIMRLAKTSKKTGTSIKHMLSVFEEYGLKYRVSKLTIKQIKKYLDKKIPVILVLQAWTHKKKINWKKDWVDGHYVVAIGYDSNKIYFEDPASVLRTYLSYKELEKRWHDKDADGRKYINCGIAVYGKKIINPKKTIHMR